jgi:hypothetical protein
MQCVICPLTPTQCGALTRTEKPWGQEPLSGEWVLAVYYEWEGSILYSTDALCCLILFVAVRISYGIFISNNSMKEYVLYLSGNLQDLLILILCPILSKTLILSFCRVAGSLAVTRALGDSYLKIASLRWVTLRPLFLDCVWYCMSLDIR